MSNQVQFHEPFALKRVLHRYASTDAVDFYTFLEKLIDEMERELEAIDPDYFELSRLALTGHMEVLPYFNDLLNKYLRTHPFKGILPECYKNVPVEVAIFQEWKGFSALHEWFTDKKYSQSSGLQIIGSNCFYREKGVYRPYPFKLPSLERADRLRRQLLANAPSITDHKEAELNMIDPLWPDRFLRIAIWAPDRVWDGFATITIRRQVVEYLNLQDQAASGSIPTESIPIFKHLCRTGRRIVVAGPVDSGKSTFANTLVGEQLEQSNERIGIIMIEKHPESLLPIVFPDHRIIPVKAKDSELMDVGIQSLRMDPQIIFMTEMRYNEWEFYLYAGEKGYKNLIGTYHTTDPQDIPYQAANAVHAIRGGSLRAHLISALKSCEIVVTMEPGEDGKKRVVRLSEICFDEEKGTVYANDIMRYDRKQKRWLYNDKLSAGIIRSMQTVDYNATVKFLRELGKQTSVNPIDDPIQYSLKSQMVL